MHGSAFIGRAKWWSDRDVIQQQRCINCATHDHASSRISERQFYSGCRYNHNVGSGHDHRELQQQLANQRDSTFGPRAVADGLGSVLPVVDPTFWAIDHMHCVAIVGRAGRGSGSDLIQQQSTIDRAGLGDSAGRIYQREFHGYRWNDFGGWLGHDHG
jgi:hypothetical protein